MTDQSRYILYNLVVWSGILCAGVATTFIVYRYSTDIANRRHIAGLFDEANAAFTAGALDRAQSLVVRAVTSPETAAQGVDQFGPRLLALPAAMNHLSERRGDHAITAATTRHPKAAVKMAVLIGDTATAQRLLTELDQQSKLDPELQWMFAQLLLNDAQFPKAYKQFDAYWSRDPDELAAAIRAASTPGGLQPTSAVALRLFHAGLWDQAFSMIPQTNDVTPEMRFLQAVQLELEGDAAPARAEYERVLDERPNHLLTRKRLLLLQQD